MAKTHGKEKTTVYLDADVLTATKTAALTINRSESAVVEDALGSSLRSDHGRRARHGLQELLQRVAAASDPDEDAALAQTVMEARAVHRGRRSRPVHGG